MIYRARAGTFFCIFFVFLARGGFSGFENYVVGLQNDFAKKFVFIWANEYPPWDAQ